MSCNVLIAAALFGATRPERTPACLGGARDGRTAAGKFSSSGNQGNYFFSARIFTTAPRKTQGD
jgi:hypothetical protein